MDSCFPPLAALSLRDTKKSTSTIRHRLSSGDSPTPSVGGHSPGKIEILQDLDFYYIRQIAHNLKVKDPEFYLRCVIKLLFWTTFCAICTVIYIHLDP